MYLSKKELMNKATIIYEKNIYDQFLTNNNLTVLAKSIYLLHKSNHGLLGYLYFKTVLPNKMYNWIYSVKIPMQSNTMDMITYLNKLFIKHSNELYDYKSNENVDLLVDTNVYRSEVTLGIGSLEDDSNIQITSKKYKDLLASDYGQIDVWAEQSVEVTPTNNRRDNRIPVWQRSMQKRHYDRSNEGYHEIDPMRSSLNVNTSGYGSEFQKIINAKDALYAKNNSISNNL